MSILDVPEMSLRRLLSLSQKRLRRSVTEQRRS